MKIKAVIVDDELIAREVLRSYLTKYCPQVEILGEAGFASLGRTAVDDEAADVMRDRDPALPGELLKRPQAPVAGFHSEAAPGLLQGCHDKVLEKAAGLDVGLELEVGALVSGSPHIARGRHELVQGDGPDHLTVSG